MASSESRRTLAPMSAEVSNENPYSRLKALERMGVVENYESIRKKTVAVIGCGGVGSVVAEMLVRCGIGRLLLYDYDTVELANMNRLFFRPEHCGMSKVAAAKTTLGAINPDSDVVAHHYNIAHSNDYDRFARELASSSIAAADQSIDLLLCCVDNFAARMVVNQVCLELGLPWMESGVAENAVSGHIQVILPGCTPCYACAPPLVVATGQPEAKRDGVCAASLPTTMGIIAGFLAQACLKFILGFGSVSEYVGYDAMRDQFPSITIKPNPECTNDSCRLRQREYNATFAQIGPRAHPLYREPTVPKPVQRSANVWGIAVVDGGASDLRIGADNSAGGFELAHPVDGDHDEVSATAQQHDTSSSTSLKEMMERLKLASS